MWFGSFSCSKAVLLYSPSCERIVLAISEGVHATIDELSLKELAEKHPLIHKASMRCHGKQDARFYKSC